MELASRKLGGAKSDVSSKIGDTQSLETTHVLLNNPIKTMKNIIKYIALIGFGFSILSFASAADNEKELAAGSYRLPDLQVRGIKSLPFPTKQGHLKIGQNLVGKTLVMKLTVDEKGRIGNIRSAKPLPGIFDPRLRDFAVQMTVSLKGWKFKPAIGTNGSPIATKIIMPVKVVERGETSTVQASLRLDTKEYDRFVNRTSSP